jgi:hypothetical protein
MARASGAPLGSDEARATPFREPPDGPIAGRALRFFTTRSSCRHEVRTKHRISGEMGTTGRKSNHDFDPDVKKMAEQLVAALAAQDAGSGLAHLAKKLAQLRASGGQPRASLSRRQRPHRPGWVVDAVTQVLADRAEPMRAKDIHAAVEALLGETVCWGSVKNALAHNISGPNRRFVRIGRGRYVLAS